MGGVVELLYLLDEMLFDCPELGWGSALCTMDPTHEHWMVFPGERSVTRHDREDGAVHVPLYPGKHLVSTVSKELKGSRACYSANLVHPSS